MTKDAFEARRKTFEEAYFQQRDVQLVDKLKSVFRRKIDKEAIRRETGISDERVLNNLAELEMKGELLAAFKLYPLIEIAWAEGGVDKREMHAVLAALEQQHIAPDSAAYAMLRDSLQNRPREDARKAWYLYAAELCKVLTPEELATFRNDLLEHARHVAQASGGILNMVLTVSPAEKRVLRAIERALTHDPE